VVTIPRANVELIE